MFYVTLFWIFLIALLASCASSSDFPLTVGDELGHIVVAGVVTLLAAALALGTSALFN